MTDVQKTPLEYSHLQECLVRHHEEHEKRSESNALGGVILPVLRRKFQNELEKNSRIRTDCIASTAEIIIPSRLMNYVMVQDKGVTHYDSVQRGDTLWFITEGVSHKEDYTRGSDTLSIMWIKHEINTLLQKLDWWQKKERKEGYQTIFFTNSDADEAEAIADVKKPRKVNDQIHWRYELNAEYCIHLSATQERILADSVYAIIMCQSMLKECVVKVVNKIGDENCSQDNWCLLKDQN